MSTKIYNGYRLKTDMSLRELHDLCMRIRQSVGKLCEELYFKKIAEIICNLLDMKEMKPSRLEAMVTRMAKDSRLHDYPLWIVQNYILERQRQIKVTNLRDPEVDFDCKIVFFPISDKILLTLYAEKKEYFKAIEAFCEVEEYGYWNNTDRPKKLTDKQWEQRRIDWDEALGDSDIPSLQGFTVTCVLDNFFPDVDRVIATMPSFKERVKSRAYNNMVDEYIGKNKEHLGDPHTWEPIFKAREYLRTDDGKKLLRTEEKRLKGILKPVFTRDDLIKPLIPKMEEEQKSHGI